MGGSRYRKWACVVGLLALSWFSSAIATESVVDRLNSTYQVFADQGTQLELRALNVGVSYFVAVEAFDESGVSVLSEVVSVP